MSTILDYLEARADTPFRLMPFNEVDALILARTAYLPFDTACGFDPTADCTISAAADQLAGDAGLADRVFWRYDVDLAHLLRENARFGPLMMQHYINEIDEREEMQFSAVTVQLSPGCCYVAYRGTDATLVGWKEDFNMAFTCPIPAQVRAVRYLEQVAAHCPPDSRFILGGHSKGGNLAIYAATFCDRQLQDRILSIYSFDAPGFPEPILRKEAYRRIRKRISAFIPQSSIVGLMLAHEEPHSIVRSKELIPILQHDIYSWQLEDTHFSYLNQLTGTSRFLDRTLKGWVSEMTPQKREAFINALYDIVTDTEAKTLHELSDNWLAGARRILCSLNGLDEPTRALLGEGISLLMKHLRKSLSDDTDRA